MSRKAKYRLSCPHPNWYRYGRYKTRHGLEDGRRNLKCKECGHVRTVSSIEAEQLAPRRERPMTAYRALRGW